MKAKIIKTVHIEAAVRISSNQGCGSSYTGSRYRIDLVAEGEISETIGWVVDYADLKNLFEPVRRRLDHHCLSDVEGLESDCSPKALERWINAQLEPWPEWFAGVRVFPPEPRAFSMCHLSPEPDEGLPRRAMFTFSAAQSLPQLQAGHPCREVHGHTYTLEIACKDGELPPEEGEHLFQRLHGQYLNIVPGLEQSTAERIAVWVWQFLEHRGVAPTLIGVQETPNNRCYYRGE